MGLIAGAMSDPRQDEGSGDPANFPGGAEGSGLIVSAMLPPNAYNRSATPDESEDVGSTGENSSAPSTVFLGTGSSATSGNNEANDASLNALMVDRGPPQIVTIRSGPSLAYSNNTGTSIANRTLPDGRTADLYADGYRISGSDQSQFVPTDMSQIGATLAPDEYTKVSDRAAKLTWDYDEPGSWHDFKAAVDRFFGITPKPVLSSAQMAEVAALRNIVLTRVDALQNPGKYNSTINMIDTAAGGPIGALAVGAVRDANPDTRETVLNLASAVDSAGSAIASTAAAKAEMQAIRNQGIRGAPNLTLDSSKAGASNGDSIGAPESAGAVMGSAQSLYDQLPARLQSKTVATTGTTKTISGYGASLPDGYTYVDPNDVIARADEIRHDLRAAGAMDQGVPGQYNASHAEKQAIVNNPSAAHVDVSRPMCKDCQAFYQAEAAAQGRSLVVSDPKVIRTFLPNGEVNVTPRKP